MTMKRTALKIAVAMLSTAAVLTLGWQVHVEQAFAKIKHWMRKAQKRTVEDTWRHVGELVQAIEPTECANYLRNAGYASIKT